MISIKKINGFHRFLRDNTEPIEITGEALEELKFLFAIGEVLGVSLVQFLPDQQVKAISGPFVGYEGKIVAVNRKKKRIIECVARIGRTGVASSEA